MRELALFAGVGGGILGGNLLGWRTVCAVEIDPFCREVLLRRQMDGCLPRFPIWDDVRTFDGKLWRGLIDVISGGFPCQDISAAGKGAGIDGERSGLWREFARIIREVRPQYVFVENSPMLTVRGIGRVLGDLAEMGYDARWGVLGAIDAGAPHERQRIWILANSVRDGLERQGRLDTSDTRKPELSLQTMANSSVSRLERSSWKRISREERQKKPSNGSSNNGWWSTEPDVGRVANGISFRVDRLRAIGNGQVPAVAASAWKILANNEDKV